MERGAAQVFLARFLLLLLGRMRWSRGESFCPSRLGLRLAFAPSSPENARQASFLRRPRASRIQRHSSQRRARVAAA